MFFYYLFFINLCYSLRSNINFNNIINFGRSKKQCEIPILRNISENISKLHNTDTNYYIHKNLNIHYKNDNFISKITVESDWIFFYFIPILDSDQDVYNKEYDEYVKYKLTPHMQPVIIYINDTFVKPHFENKYKQLVEDNIKEYNKTWNDIIKIMKVEERH